MAYNVKFLKGTVDGYNALKTANKLDANTFYYVGNNKFFLGEIELDNEDVKQVINNLANVATSGAAVDVSVADADGNFTGSTVEAVLAELYEAIQGADASKRVYMYSPSSSDYAGVYQIWQGADGQHDATKDTLVGTINIPKDMVVSSGEVKTVETADVPYAGAAVGDVYIDLTIANATQDHLYIPANAFVEYVTGGTAADGIITVSVDANTHVVTATIGDATVTKAKLTSAVQTSLGYADTSVQDIATGTTNGTIKFKSTGDAAQYSEVAVAGLGSAAYTASTAYDAAGTAQRLVETLDGSATIASVASDVVTIKGGITEADGVVSNDSSADIVLAKAAKTGAAADISIADAGDIITATTVEGALAEIKAQANAADSAIAALDADIDASASSSDAKAVAVITGITQVNGLITAVDSAAVDQAGAATAAEAAAKAYTDTALTWGAFPSAE